MSAQVLAHVLSRVVASFEHRHPDRLVELNIEHRRMRSSRRTRPARAVDRQPPRRTPTSTVRRWKRSLVDVVRDRRRGTVTVRDRGIGVPADASTTCPRRSTVTRRPSGRLRPADRPERVQADRRRCSAGGSGQTARDSGSSEFGFALPRSTEALDWPASPAPARPPPRAERRALKEQIRHGDSQSRSGRLALARHQSPARSRSSRAAPACSAGQSVGQHRE